jgi:AraC-like DNA-binding protein
MSSRTATRSRSCASVVSVDEPCAHRQHESELGAIEVAARAPAPSLRPHVLRYQGYRAHRAVAQAQRAAAERRDADPVVRARASLARGRHVSPVVSRGPGRRLHVDRARRPGGRAADRPRSRAGSAARRRAAAGRIEWAWRRLVESDGRVTVGALASELGWSRRHFGALFRAEVGLPPKRVARIARFRRALSLSRPAAQGSPRSPTRPATPTRLTRTGRCARSPARRRPT